MSVEVCACGTLVKEKPDMVVARTEVEGGIHDVHERPDQPPREWREGGGGRSVSRRKRRTVREGRRPTQFSSSRQTAVNKRSVPFPQPGRLIRPARCPYQA